MRKLATSTNKHLADSATRRAEILDSVIASSRIEGITLSKAQEQKIAKRVGERLKKQYLKKQ